MDRDKYAGDGEAKCVIAKDRKEIERVTDNLEREISALQNVVDRLLDVVEPITRPAEPTESCDRKEEGTITPLGGTIDSYVRRIKMTNENISDTLRRIEL